jgi:prepilin-type N-terminal cleavage/methylation domain-containing protein
MNSHPQLRSSQAAFTLIELLVVITIIAILMGLLFPAIGIVKDQARKTEAKSAVVQIAAAVKQYYTEYGKYPPVDDTATGDVAVGDAAGGAVSNADLFYVLRAIPNGKNATPSAHSLNPRRIVFYEGKAASDPALPKSGFVNEVGNAKYGAYFDPWGKQYMIVMDSNYNNVVDLQNYYNDFKEASDSDKGARTGVAVFSVGKDQVLGTKVGASTTGDKNYRDAAGKVSDDIISWQ